MRTALLACALLFVTTSARSEPKLSDANAAFGKQLAAWAALATPPLPQSGASDPETQKYLEQELEHKKIVLRVVNRLWAQAGHAFRAEYLKILKDDYRAPLGTVDFHKAAEAARVAINKWVAEATEQKIKELLAPGTVASDTKLVITNAVYFKAHWEEEFSASMTKDEPFYVAGGKQVKAPLMSRTAYFQIAKLDGAMMAELPYGEGRLVMDVVLPNAKDGLVKIEEAYGAGALPKWVAALSSVRAEVMLPKFRTSSSFELAAELSGMGMARAFKYPGADFSGIDGTHDLFIGSVVHQAFVDVDEHGTEAAAATAVMMRAGSAPPTAKPIEFRADHPFLFFIRDRTSDVVLFAGRLADPSKK